jgi:hypothetical protein
LDAILKEYRANFDKVLFDSFCDRAKRIDVMEVDGDKKNQKLKGTADAWKFLLDKREGFFSGEMIAPKDDVKTMDMELRYQQILKEKFIDSGLPDICLFEGDMIGVLGYLGGRKSTICRFIGYNAFLQGRNVLLLTIENDVPTETDLLAIMHAHNSDSFGSTFSSLTYNRFKKGLLTEQERGGLIAAEKDLKQHEGSYLIRKPIANWESCRHTIEAVNRKTPLDLVIIDYIQLLDPMSNSYKDQRTLMTTMIKEIRQFFLTFDNGLGHKLIHCCPS